MRIAAPADVHGNAPALSAVLHDLARERIDAIVGPGGVGRPYEGERGARWALLGPGVELRTTQYDRDAAAALRRAGGIPAVKDDLRMLLEPPTREESIAHAASLVSAG